MVNCLWLITSPQSRRRNQPVMLPPASTAHGSPEVTDARSSPDPRPVFHQPPAGLLQQHSDRHHRSADAEAAGCPERRRPADCRRQKIRSLQSYNVRPTLVASQTTRHLQALRSGLQVPPRHGPGHHTCPEFHVPTSSQASRPRLRFSSTNSLLVPRTRTTTHMLRRQEHRCSQSGSMERSTV